jgi:hypothetical protein
MYLKRAFYVRKRFDGDGLYLIHLTTIVRIGEFGEIVWDSLNGVNSIDEIAEILSLRLPQLDPIACAALVGHTLIVFEQHGFLQPAPGSDQQVGAG